MLAGDFSETRLLHERDHGGDDMMHRCARFANWIENNGLTDLGYSGSCFTWARANTWETRKSARLDRALRNEQWRARFQEGAVRHLIRSYSDHCPILIGLNGFVPIMRNAKSFHLTSHKHFDEYLKLHWKGGLPLVPALSSLADDLVKWNKEVFGNLFRRQRKTWALAGQCSETISPRRIALSTKTGREAEERA